MFTPRRYISGGQVQVIGYFQGPAAVPRENKVDSLWIGTWLSPRSDVRITEVKKSCLFRLHDKDRYEEIKNENNRPLSYQICYYTASVCVLTSLWSVYWNKAYVLTNLLLYCQGKRVYIVYWNRSVWLTDCQKFERFLWNLILQNFMRNVTALNEHVDASLRAWNSLSLFCAQQFCVS